MAIQFKELRGPDFTSSNLLRARAAEQIKQGLAQGAGAFSQFNTGLTNRATQEGLNQIRGLGSRADVEATPLSSITPQYADQSKLQTAYDANKAKQQGLYEEDMMQQGLAKIQGIKSLDEYGQTSADQILSQFGQDLSAAKKTRLLDAFEGQDEAIKQQMATDYTWNQQQATQAEQPAVDALGTAIQSANVGELDQVRNQITASPVSDATKNKLLQQVDKRSVVSQNLINAQRSEAGYQAQQNLYKYQRDVEVGNQEAINTLQASAAKAGLRLNQNNTLDTTGMTIAEEQTATNKAQPLFKAFQKSTKTTEEYDQYLTTLQGVTGHTPDMLNKAKADYAAIQEKRDALVPELQAQYDQDIGIYNQVVQSQVDTLNMQKATVVRQYQDVATITNDELNMSIGDANQSARTALQAQGMDIDSGDMEDLMGLLTTNLKEEDPYILAEVAKALPIIPGFMFGDADYGWFNKSNVKVKLGEVLKDVRNRRSRAMSALDAVNIIDNNIIDLNTSKIQKSKELTAKLRLLNPKTTRSIFK